MQVLSVDWSGNRPIQVCDEDYSVSSHPTFKGFIKSLYKPTIIVLESPFESFVQSNRQELINLCDQMGYGLGVLSPRGTPRMVKSMGLPKEDKNNDINNAKALMARVHAGEHVKKAVNHNDPLYDKKFKLAQHSICIKRYEGTKDQYSDNYSRDLPGKKDSRLIISDKKDPSGVLDLKKYLIGSNGKYRKSLIAAVAVAAGKSSSRKEFERMIGLYAHGYPSQLRSDVFFWSWKFIREDQTATLSQFRKSVRWLYHRIKEIQHSGAHA